uniref:Uncharacterized protein n=1 Tax=Caenorhabditis japonica TaxID=281687 RepID=A0A8R1HWK6_CAEJA
MSDNLSGKDLSNAFKYLLAYQLDSIAVDGVMPSAHGALHKLLCSCYSKDTQVIEYDTNLENEQYVKTSSTENNIKGMSPCSSSPSSPPRSPLLSPPPPPSKVQKTSSPIIVEVYDDTPNSKKSEKS